MSVMVDYRCGTCGVQEARVTSPPPPLRECPNCGAAAQRLFAPVGLSRGRTGTPAGRAAGCGSGVDIPGSCTMHPEVASVWAARFRGDGRALDAALEKQERYMNRSGITPDQLAHGIKPPRGLGQPSASTEPKA
jgi:hypothetical protein